MKVGDLVQYNPPEFHANDDMIGILTKLVERDAHGRSWAEVTWSMRTGPYCDEVPLKHLRRISESR